MMITLTTFFVAYFWNSNWLTDMNFLLLICVIFWLGYFMKLMSFFNLSILMMLLILEIIMLLTLMTMVFSTLKTLMGIPFYLSFFSLAVCEASFGLGLLISFSRNSNQTNLTLNM